MWFIFSGIIFLVWAISIIILYYTFNTSHNALLSSNGNGLLVIYFSIIFITYGIYKLLAFSKNNTSTKWSIWQIIGAFFLQLLFTCFLYVAIDSSGNAVSLWTNPSSLVLFVHILQFLLYPIFFGIFMESRWWKHISFYTNTFHSKKTSNHDRNNFRNNSLFCCYFLIRIFQNFYTRKSYYNARAFISSLILLMETNVLRKKVCAYWKIPFFFIYYFSGNNFFAAQFHYFCLTH